MNSRFVFDAPGRDFTERIPLGNGVIGAMVGGEPERDTITLNHSALWSSCVHDAVNPQAKDALPKIREAYFAGRYAEADELAQKCLMRVLPYNDGEGADSPFGAYLPLGELEIFSSRTDVRHAAEYRRELDIASGICSVQYSHRGTHFTHTYFTSFSEPVFTIRLSADKPGDLTAAIRLRRMLNAVCTVLPEGILRLSGEVSGGNTFCAFAKVRSKGGKVTELQDGLLVTGADEAEILLSASTSLAADNPEDAAKEILDQAADFSFDELLERHRKAYTAENGDFTLEPGPEPQDAELVRTVFDCLRNGLFPGFCAARFAMFSRYLLMCSSRRGSLPATIQGIWNDAYRPLWNCDYHLNANTQMIYWPAEACGLSENHLPLLGWLKTLAQAGTDVAKRVFGARGWTAGWTSNPFGFAAPGKSLEWGLFPEAGAWMCMHIRDHFDCTRDHGFLRDFYPILRGACEFCLDMLAPDPATGKLLFGPTVAPEHGFIGPDGERRFIVWGTTTAQECVWELFRFTLEAGALVMPDDPLLDEVGTAFGELGLPGIDADGMIGKWIQPLTPDGCRHLRHIMGLYPDTRLASHRSPEITAALEKTLLDHEEASRQGCWGAGSWSGGWLVNLWARLKNGEKAEQALNLLMQKTLTENLLALNCNIFQQDGHSGCLSGIAEMLVQENEGRIELLPALPASWPDGSVRGLHVRGGFVLNMIWKNGKTVTVTLRSKNGGTCVLTANKKSHPVTLDADGEITLDL